ncbi:heavy-metal-associated domain-containing protein [Mucilaginibacter mali]|uniref:Heavy-metal-associated domain-containing protein n=1 Tax=Mucilaginibacter mali TaxID=2740462 RepID=A0A7D4QB05_9SPHI|nr:heavy-metal-associated domain-containing protein [Mucilaginibacter mali]QKJ32291.1 heavy-metal-associated domain-containing protein [Mucilaginibacter mali]
MKFLKIFPLLMLFCIGIAKAQFTKAEVQVSGLTCSMCSKATEKALRTLDFIGDIKPDLNRNLFVLTFKSNAPVNLDLISKKVQGAGFAINNLKATFNFANAKVDNNAFSYQGDTFLIVNGADKAPGSSADITVVDKGFAPASVYKKYAAKSADVKTGKLYRVVI